MKHCMNCNSELPDEASFCGVCGYRMSEKTFNYETIQFEDPIDEVQNKRKIKDIITGNIIVMVVLIFIVSLGFGVGGYFLYQKVSENENKKEIVKTYGKSSEQSFYCDNYEFVGNEEIFLSQVKDLCITQQFSQKKYEYQITGEHEYICDNKKYTRFYDDRGRLITQKMETSTDDMEITYSNYYFYHDSKSDEVELSVFIYESSMEKLNYSMKTVSSSEYFYDSNGKLSNTTYRSYDVAQGEESGYYTAEFDADGNMTSFVWNDNLSNDTFSFYFTTNYTYSTINKKKVVTKIQRNGSSLSAPENATFEYDEKGNLIGAQGSFDALSYGLPITHPEESPYFEKENVIVKVEYEGGLLSAIVIKRGDFQEISGGTKNLIYVRYEFDENRNVIREIFFTNDETLKEEIPSLRITTYDYYYEDPLASLKKSEKTKK